MIGRGCAMREVRALRALRDGCHRLAALGLVTATDGNLSLRLGENRYLITPSGLAKERVAIKDLLVIDGAGEPLGPGRASIERHFHLAIYKMRPEVGAICHAHPFYGTWLADHLRPEWTQLLLDSALRFQAPAVIADCPPGSDRLAEAVGEAAQTHDLILIPRHGAITYAATMNEAIDRMAALERWAKHCYIYKPS